MKKSIIKPQTLFYIFKLLTCLVIFFFQPVFIHGEQLIYSTQQIRLKKFKYAHNPSIVSHKGGFMLSFRINPTQFPKDAWQAEMGIVILDKNFKIIGKPQILPTPWTTRTSPPQTQDPRLLTHNNTIYIFYNDNPYVLNPQAHQRRDMFYGTLKSKSDQYFIDSPVMLPPPKQYLDIPWQKNWSPFIWNNKLYLSYMLNPHEVVAYNPETQVCETIAYTLSNIDWKWGTLCGGTPALYIENEYLGFFHSSTYIMDPNLNRVIKYYFMGAYTFEKDPPFKLKKISPKPLTTKKFYKIPKNNMHVIFPGGFVVKDDTIFLTYGKNDSEIHIAKINKQKLLESLIEVE